MLAFIHYTTQIEHLIVLFNNSPSIFFLQVALLVVVLVASALAKPAEVLDFETEKLDHEQSVSEKNTYKCSIAIA